MFQLIVLFSFIAIYGSAFSHDNCQYCKEQIQNDGTTCDIPVNCTHGTSPDICDYCPMCAIGEEGWRSCGEGLECYYNQTEQDQTVQWFGHCRTKETGGTDLQNLFSSFSIFPSPTHSLESEEESSMPEILFSSPILMSFNYEVPIKTSQEESSMPEILFSSPILMSFNYEVPIKTSQEESSMPEILFSSPILMSFNYEVPIKTSQEESSMSEILFSSPILMSFNYEVPIKTTQEQYLPSSSVPLTIFPSPTSEIEIQSNCLVSCDRQSCPADFNSSECKYGIVADKSGCCKECAKGPGDVCGGLWGSRGFCAVDARCMVRLDFGQPYSAYIKSNGTCISDSASHKITAHSSCSEVTETHDTVKLPECRLTTCKSRCSLDFCKTEKNMYCSANGTAIYPIAERSPCQHTTCKACRFHVSPNCPTCPEPVKKRCLRKYFLCIDDHYNQSNETILELQDPRAQNVTGKILCHVPNFKH